MKKIVLIILLLLAVTVFVSGCVQEPTTIKSKEEVSKAVVNISADIKDVSSTFDEILKSFG